MRVAKQGRHPLQSRRCTVPSTADASPQFAFISSIRGREVKGMWETCSVRLDVRLPRDMAQQAEEVQRSDPEFLSRVVLYGLTRRSIFRHLRESAQQKGPGERPEGRPELAG